MQFRTLFAVVPFLLSNILLASAEEETTIYTTVTTTIEVVSTSWSVVTMTREVPLGNNQRPILVESQASTTANYTGAPTPEPTNAAIGNSASLKLAAVAGAAAVFAGMW